jgi:hypothetical protein
VRGAAEDADAASGVFDDGENVKPAAGQSSGFEEVGGEDRVRLAAQERGPGVAVSTGHGIDTGILEDLSAGDGATLIPRTASSPWTRR